MPSKAREGRVDELGLVRGRRVVGVDLRGLVVAVAHPLLERPHRDAGGRHRVPNVCRRSWNRTSRTPARFSAHLKRLRGASDPSASRCAGERRRGPRPAGTPRLVQPVERPATTSASGTEREDRFDLGDPNSRERSSAALGPLGQPVDVHPPERQQLALTQTTHRRGEVEARSNRRDRPSRPRPGRSGRDRSLSIRRRRPLQRLASTAARRRRGGRTVAARSIVAGLCGERSASVARSRASSSAWSRKRISRPQFSAGLLDLVARVDVRPPLANGKVEDAVEETEVVEGRFRREPGEAELDEVLHVLGGDLRDWPVPEVRFDVDAQVALVVLGRRSLPALRRNCLMRRFPTGRPSAVPRRAPARSVPIINSRSRTSAWLFVIPSRLPAWRTGPSERLTGLPLTYHFPIQIESFAYTIPVPRGRL